MCPPRSELTVTMIAPWPEDAFNDVTDRSFLDATML